MPTRPGLDQPLTFAPILKERIWGGRRLAELYGKPLPPGAPIGESWELVDREHDQSVVDDGPLAGTTLNALWNEHREEVFGAAGRASDDDRFPLLVKLLDARETLSLQVHPPPRVAPALGGEPKSEVWLITDADPGAHLFAGLRAGVDRDAFERQLRGGDDVSDLLHRLPVRAGDALVVPSGRVHAIGAGSVLLEVQQRSDTTYRVHDFGRLGLDGKPRDLHVDASLQCIDFADTEPALVPPGDVITDWEHFTLVRRRVDGPTPLFDDDEAAVVTVLEGEAGTSGRRFAAGRTLLWPAGAPRALHGTGSVAVATLP